MENLAVLHRDFGNAFQELESPLAFPAPLATECELFVQTPNFQLLSIDYHVQEFLMQTTKLIAAATTVACLALLAACGGGSAANDAAGTLMEAKQSTVEVKNATTDEAPTAEDQAAAAEAANVAAEGDAASAAKANGKGGKLANGRLANGGGTCIFDANGQMVCK